MSTINNVEHLTINVGDEHMNGGVAGKIAISTNQPTEVGSGCTVYLFNHGKLKAMDVLFEYADGDKTIIDRVRAHSDLSPLDHVCVEAILMRYEGNPPNEVFCKLEKLDAGAVRSLSVVGASAEPVVIDVKPEKQEVLQITQPTAVINGTLNKENDHER